MYAPKMHVSAAEFLLKEEQLKYLSICGCASFLSVNSNPFVQIDWSFP
jgi:hypothetical protein